MKKYSIFLFLSCLTFSTVAPMEFGKNSACSSTEKYDTYLNSKEETNTHGSLPSSISELPCEHIKEYVEKLIDSSLGYAELFEQFKKRADLPQLLKTFLILNKDQCRSYPTYIHLMIKALIAQYYQTGNYGPDHTDNILQLFTYFETDFPQIAVSLKMSFYLSLPTSEHLMLNNFLVPHLSVEKFFDQIPDKNFLSNTYKVLDRAPSYIRYLKGETSFDTDIVDELYDIQLTPFLLSLLNNNRMEKHAFELFEEAVSYRDTHLVEHLINLYGINPNSMIYPLSEKYGYHPLFVATIFGDLPMVEKLLELGSSPFVVVSEKRMNRSVLEEVLRSCPSSSHGLPKRGQSSIPNLDCEVDYEYVTYEFDETFSAICCKMIQSFVRHYFPTEKIELGLKSNNLGEDLFAHLKYLSTKLRCLRTCNGNVNHKFVGLANVIDARIAAFEHNQRNTVSKTINNSSEPERTIQQIPDISSMLINHHKKIASARLFDPRSKLRLNKKTKRHCHYRVHPIDSDSLKASKNSLSSSQKEIKNDKKCCCVIQ